MLLARVIDAMQSHFDDLRCVCNDGKGGERGLSEPCVRLLQRTKDVGLDALAAAASVTQKMVAARNKKLTPERRREIAVAAVKARWDRVRAARPTPQT